MRHGFSLSCKKKEEQKQQLTNQKTYGRKKVVSFIAMADCSENAEPNTVYIYLKAEHLEYWIDKGRKKIESAICL